MFLDQGAQLWHMCIYPRTVHGLLGILFAPFVHFSWAHLFANVVSATFQETHGESIGTLQVPFAILGFMLTLRSEVEYCKGESLLLLNDTP